ncbi:RNA helicase, partial [Streptomyces microflavus]
RRDERPAGGSGGFRSGGSDRPSGGFRSGGSSDRRDDRGGRPFERRDNDRPAFNRDRRDERPAGGAGGFRSGGSDRPFNRDRRDDRPAGGFRAGGTDRPTGRRDEHRGANTGTNTGSFGRRDDKPRWKRNG